MKKAIIFLVFATFAMISPAYAALQVTVNSLTPQPASIGSDVTLGLTFTNTGYDTLNTRASLDVRPPFSLKTSTEPLDQGFSICGLCSRTNTYYLNIDPSARSGTYPLFVRTADNATTMTIDVVVQGRPNVVLIPEPVTNVSSIGEFILILNATNIGSGRASQVKIISKSTNFISLGASVSTVDVINPGDTRRTQFTLAPDEDLKAGAYNLPFEINYVDENGAVVNYTQNVGVRLANKGELSLQSIKAATQSGAPPVAGQPATVIVRFENIGRGDANSIESEINCSGTTARTFLGQLKRDEDAPAVFDISFPKSGKNTCALTAQFSDDLGQHVFTSSFDVNVKNPDYTGIVILVIIVAAAAYILYRRKRRPGK